MNIIEELNKIDQAYENSPLVESLHYDLHIDNSEIIFKYYICYGWDTVYEDKCLFNACDRKTNIESLISKIKEMWLYYERLIREFNTGASQCSCAGDQGGPCSACMEAKFNL